MTGFVAGLICSVIFYVIFTEINGLLTGSWLPEPGFSPQFIAIISVCTNLIPFLIFNAANKALSMRGIIGATITLAAVVIIVYRNEFF